MASEEGDAEADRVEPHPQYRLIYAIVVAAMVMGSIDATMVSVALPVLQDDLDISITSAAWTLTFYSLARVIALPVVGRLSDQFGRRRIFLWAVALFSVASLGCGLAGNIYILVALRTVQSAAGAAMMPSATGIVVDHFGYKRSWAIGMFTSIIPIGSIIGPAIGGLVVSHFSWRAIFLINVPVGICVGLLAWRYLPDSDGPVTQRGSVDVRGVLLLGVSVLAAMLGLMSVNDLDGTGFPGALTTYLVVAVGGVVLFYRHIGRTPDPFISRFLLFSTGFGVMNVINLLFIGFAVGFGTLVPLYASDRFGLDPLGTGGLLAARAVGVIVVSALAAWALGRVGYRWPIAVGLAVTALGFAVMAGTPTDHASVFWLTVGGVLSGLGMGAAMPAVSNACLQLAPHQAAAIAGLRGMFVQMGSIVSVSVFSSVAAGASDAGLAQAGCFAAFAVLLVLLVPLTLRIPEHRGAW